MSLSSQLALEDVGGLLLGPSFLTADPMGPLLDQDEEEALSPSSSLSSQGRAPPSPPLSFSSSYASSPFSSSSTPPPSPPPPFHPSFLESKAGPDVLSLPWLGEGDLLDAHVGLDVGKEDAFSGMDWMTEKIDLSDFDLESLMGSCSQGNPPSSPEELLASLESHLDLEPFAALPAQPEVLDLGLPLVPVPLDLPLPEEEMEMEVEEEPVPEVVEWKSEPRSPAPLSPAPLSPAPLSPAPLSPAPLSPAFTLELGSEVDVLEVDKITTATVIPEAIIPEASLQTVSTPILLTISPSATFMVVLTPKDEPALLPTSSSSPPPSSSPSSDSESDSGIDSSVSGSPARCSSSPHPAPSSSSTGSCRTKPYSRPSSPSSVSPKVKTAGGGPPKVVEKKLKKMEQNKTAATRYRQKKRVEQDVMNTELGGLESKNRELAEKAESISREIQYLKDLMEEVRSAKTRRAVPKPSAGP